MRYVTRLLLVSFFAGFCAVATAAGPTIPADLAARVKAWDDAQIKGDKAALEDLLADDFVLINSRDQRQTKADLVADYTKPGFKLDPFVVEQPVELVWQDGAVMGGIARLTGVDDGAKFSVTLRFSDVWAKRDGKWRVIYAQARRLEAP
jgi:ketosteroid isomerase-like protein